MENNKAIKIVWYSKSDALWLGLIEINGNLGLELYRVRIEKKTANEIYFYCYTFERYSIETKSWDLGLHASNYPIPVFLSIRDACQEQLLLIRPTTIVFVTDSEKRTKLFQYLVKSILEGADVTFLDFIYKRKNCTIFILANKKVYKNRIRELKKVINSGFDNGILF